MWQRQYYMFTKSHFLLPEYTRSLISQPPLHLGWAYVTVLTKEVWTEVMVTPSRHGHKIPKSSSTLSLPLLWQIFEATWLRWNHCKMDGASTPESIIGGKPPWRATWTMSDNDHCVKPLRIWGFSVTELWPYLSWLIRYSYMPGIFQCPTGVLRELLGYFTRVNANRF